MEMKVQTAVARVIVIFREPYPGILVHAAELHNAKWFTSKSQTPLKEEWVSFRLQTNRQSSKEDNRQRNKQQQTAKDNVQQSFYY
jgi:hypothetical protein